MKVVELIRTCIACPSQWEGHTDDGQPVYVRYRHGFLSVRLGGCSGQEIILRESELDRDGYMTIEELGELVPEIDWPFNEKELPQ